MTSGGNVWISGPKSDRGCLGGLWAKPALALLNYPRLECSVRSSARTPPHHDCASSARGGAYRNRWLSWLPGCLDSIFLETAKGSLVSLADRIEAAKVMCSDSGLSRPNHGSSAVSSDPSNRLLRAQPGGLRDRSETPRRSGLLDRRPIARTVQPVDLRGLWSEGARPSA